MMLALRDAIPRDAMPLAEAWERELNGSTDGSWKSMAIDQREMESCVNRVRGRTVPGAG